MNILKSFLIFITICCFYQFGQSQNIKDDAFGKNNSHQFILKDSIYKATLLLNEKVTQAKKNNQPLALAYTYQTLGSIYSEIDSYNTAATYYIKSAKLFDSLHKYPELDNIFTQLSRTYVNAKNYTKFDSILPLALEQSASINSINYFYNLESQIQKNYFLRDYENALISSNLALNQLNDFNNLSKDIQDQKSLLTSSFQYYKGIALVNLKQFKEGYNILFNLKLHQLEEIGGKKKFSVSKVSTLNYYKFRYFNEQTKQLDSANKYLLKADSLKYIAINDFRDRISENGDLIYKIINTEKKLELTNTKREQQKIVSNAFLLSTIILSLLLTGLLIFFYYYYKNRKHIKTINQKLKETNKKLKIIDKERLEFFSILSHELRTPIYGIGGLATLIKQEQSSEKRKGYLNALISSSNYISVLIDNVLQISKLKFENKKLHVKPTNISQLVKRISSSLKVSAHQKGLELHTNLEKTNWDEFLIIDGVVLSQILINLSYNAIRYTSKGFISINLTEQSRSKTHVNILFEIKDSGIGIQSEHRDIIFNAFENKTFLEKNSSGSGLGLYIVKTLLKSYNAEINFISKPNEGSTFYFDIDFEIAHINGKENSQLFSQLKDTPIKILVVDDNSINLMVTQKNVEKIPGYKSETASHGKEAIGLVKEKDFDLILMDINMPDMDGFEATKHIRLFNPHIPILALTALNSAEIQDKATACGMNQIITKPYDFEEFKSTILSYCNVYQE